MWLSSLQPSISSPITEEYNATPWREQGWSLCAFCHPFPFRSNLILSPVVPLKSTCLAALTFHRLLPGHKHLPSSGEFYSHFILFFEAFYFVSGHSWLTMLWQFQVNNKETQPYTYLYLFSPKFPSHPGRHKHWTEFHVLCSRSLLAIHFKPSSVYTSIPNSPVIPSSHSSPSNHKLVL